MNATITATTYVRKLRAGDVFVDRRATRGRPSFDEEPQVVWTVTSNPKVVDGKLVKIYLRPVDSERKRSTAFLYDIDARVLLAG